MMMAVVCLFRWSSNSLVSEFKNQEGSVDDYSLLKTREGILHQVLKQGMAPPRVLARKYHLAYSCLFLLV